MQQASASMYVRQVNATTGIIDLHGSFSDLSEEFLIDIHKQFNPVTTSTIILNCSELESINSHGIRLLIMILINFRRQQKYLQICGLSENNQYIFEITRLSQFIEIVSTQTQTVATVHMV